MGYNENYDASAYGCALTFLVITTAAVIVRVVSRRLRKARFWVDDGMIYLAYVTNTAAVIILCIQISHGIFDQKKLRNIDLADSSWYHETGLAYAIMYLVTATCSKISALFLYRRIFGMKQRWFQLLWWASLLIIFPCWFALSLFFFVWVQVKDFDFQSTVAIDGSAASAFVSAMSDIMVLFLPIRCILQVQMSGYRKLAITSLLCCGLLTTLISLARAGMNFWQVTHGPIRWTETYFSFNYLILTLAEASAGVFCVSIMIAKPFFVKVKQAARSRASRASVRFNRYGMVLTPRSHSDNSERSLPLVIEDCNTIRRTIAYDVSSIFSQYNQQTELASQSVNLDDVTEMKEHSQEATA